MQSHLIQKVDYLDVILNLNDGTYRPFHKANEETAFIHLEFDCASQIIKKIPRSKKATKYIKSLGRKESVNQ